MKWARWMNNIKVNLSITIFFPWIWSFELKLMKIYYVFCDKFHENESRTLMHDAFWMELCRSKMICSNSCLPVSSPATLYRTHLIYDWMSVIKEKSCMQSNQIHYCNNKTITNKNKERSELVSKLRLWYGTMRYKSERRPITQKALCFLAILSRSIEFAMNFRLMLNKLTSNKLADDQTNSYGSQNKCCSVNWPN